jgi:hypothetical protein
LNAAGRAGGHASGTASPQAAASNGAPAGSAPAAATIPGQTPVAVNVGPPATGPGRDNASILRDLAAAHPQGFPPARQQRILDAAGSGHLCDTPKGCLDHFNCFDGCLLPPGRQAAPSPGAAHNDTMHLQAWSRRNAMREAAKDEWFRTHAQCSHYGYSSILGRETCWEESAPAAPEDFINQWVAAHGG